MQIDTTSSPMLDVGQTRVIMVWKMIEYVGLVLFTVIVPRAMGPDLYGRFAVLLSCVALFTMASGLGGLAIFGRFIPEYRAQGEKLKTQILFTQLFIARVLVAGLLGMAFILIFPMILPEVSPTVLAAGAGVLFLSAIATTCYHLFYGLNALGRWLSRESLTRFILIILLFMFGGMYAFDRASLALFMTQIGFVLLGLFWTRQYFTMCRPVLDYISFSAYLRFGLLFFAANLLLLCVWRGGEVIVLLFSKQASEVAFFNVANAIAMAFSALIGQLATILIPSLTTLFISGKETEMDFYVGYSIKYLTIASFFILFSVHTIGPWVVEIALGKQYIPVISNLKILIFGLFPIILVRVGISMAVVQKKPKKTLWIAAVAFVTFVLVSTILVPHTGSQGASVAVVLAMVSAGIIAYHQFSLAPVLATGRFWLLLLLGLATIVLISLPLIPDMPMGLLALFLYISLLFLTKVVSIKEIREISRALIA